MDDEIPRGELMLADGDGTTSVTIDAVSDAASSPVPPAALVTEPAAKIAEVPSRPCDQTETDGEDEQAREAAAREEMTAMTVVEQVSPSLAAAEEPVALVGPRETRTVAITSIAAAGGVAQATLPRPRVGPPPPRVRSLATWLLVVRPHALLFALAPVVVALATLAAEGAPVSWPLAAAAVLAIALAQAGCSAVDAYREDQHRQRAVRRGDAAVLGTPSPLLSRGIYPLDALRAGCVLLALAGVVAVPLVVAGGAPVLALVGAGAAAGILYAVGRYPLKFYPIGDVLLLAGLGPGIVVVVALVQHQRVSALLLVLGVVLALYMLASVFAAHLRDATRLRALGRRTLAGLLDTRQARLVCAGCVAVPYLAVLALGLPVGGPHPLLLAFLSLPAAAMAMTGVLRAAPGEPLALVVRQLGRAYFLFVIWLLVGLAMIVLWTNLP